METRKFMKKAKVIVFWTVWLGLLWVPYSFHLLQSFNIAQIVEKKVINTLSLRETSISTLQVQVEGLEAETERLVKEVEDLHKANEALMAERANMDVEVK